MKALWNWAFHGFVMEPHTHECADMASRGIPIPLHDAQLPSRESKADSSDNAGKTPGEIRYQ
jgi:hypothetical protein